MCCSCVTPDMQPDYLIPENNWSRGKSCITNSIAFSKAPRRDRKTKRPKITKNQQFWDFWGAHGSGYMGLADITGATVGAQVPILSQKDHPTHPRGNRRVLQKAKFSSVFKCH